MITSISVTNTKPIKSKIKICICSLKRNGLSILFCIFTICLVLFSKTNLIAAKDGLILWATAVVPSLFPFFVANEMLSYTNIVSFLGKILNPITMPLFGIHGEGAYVFIMGLISGYPVGAKIISNFIQQDICTKEEAERMLAFTNNSGPLFIIGTVGITLFGNTSIGILLFITHVLACISVGIVLNLIHKYRIKKLSNYHSNKDITNYNFNTSTNSKYCKYKCNIYNNQKENISPNISSLGEILGNSIKNATSTILMIGGFVVIFSVIISILNQAHILASLSSFLSPFLSILGIPNMLVQPLLSGIVELTNGASLVANIITKNISINIIIIAFLLGFGGISVLLQVFSIISKNGLSIKKYAYGKLLQGLFAAFYTFIALQVIPFFQFNL